MDYHGELGTDFANPGAWRGRLVVQQWQAVVEGTMPAVKAWPNGG